ncbi:cysteine proteinase [Backusella circina FSU 941]|nr:cysteine proteinase [Backusella circina FSU 941]
MTKGRPFNTTLNDYPPWNLVVSKSSNHLIDTITFLYALTPPFFNLDVFTDMIKRFGIKDVAAEEVPALENLDTLSDVTTYALVLSFKCNGGFFERNTVKSDRDAEELVFTAQVVLRSCATLSILNAVSNLDIERGKIIQDFLDFTEGCDSIIRGNALGSIREIELIHNSYEESGNEEETIVIDSNEDQDSPEEGGSPEDTSEDSQEESSSNAQVHNESGIYHTVSFISKNGFIWELDGMKRYPIKLGSVMENENWIAQLKPFLIKKTQNSGSEVTIMALVKNSAAKMESQLNIFVDKSRLLYEDLSREIDNLRRPSTSRAHISDPSKAVRNIRQQKRELDENIGLLRKEIAEAREKDAKELSTLERVHDEYYPPISVIASVAVEKSYRLQDYSKSSTEDISTSSQRVASTAPLRNEELKTDNAESEDDTRVTRYSVKGRGKEAVSATTSMDRKGKGKAIAETQERIPQRRPRRQGKVSVDNQAYKATDDASESSTATNDNGKRAKTSKCGTSETIKESSAKRRRK